MIKTNFSESVIQTNSTFKKNNFRGVFPNTPKYMSSNTIFIIYIYKKYTYIFLD